MSDPQHPFRLDNIPTHCENCLDEIDPDNIGHIVEAFETTGKIICEDCWAGFCMDNQV